MKKISLIVGGLLLVVSAAIASVSAYSYYQYNNPYYYGYEYNCSNNYFPVCGTDNKTYNNTCKARQAGVNIKYYGSCQTLTYRNYSRPYYQPYYYRPRVRHYAPRRYYRPYYRPYYPNYRYPRYNRYNYWY